MNQSPFCHHDHTLSDWQLLDIWMGLILDSTKAVAFYAISGPFFPPTTFLALSFQKEPFGWLVKTERRCRTNRIVIFEGISEHLPRTYLICFFNHVHFIGSNDTSEPYKIIKKPWKTFAGIICESHFWCGIGIYSFLASVWCCWKSELILISEVTYLKVLKFILFNELRTMRLVISVASKCIVSYLCCLQ